VRKILALVLFVAALFPFVTLNAAGPCSRSIEHPAGWDRVAELEARINGKVRWDANTGNGFYGGLQFSRSTWNRHKRCVPEARSYARADHAPPAVQKAVANFTFGEQGFAAWPRTSSKLGYR